MSSSPPEKPRRNPWLTALAIFFSVAMFAPMIYFALRREYAKVGYTFAIFYFISYGSRVIYAIIYENKTGRTPTDDWQRNGKG